MVRSGTGISEFIFQYADPEFAGGICASGGSVIERVIPDRRVRFVAGQRDNAGLLECNLGSGGIKCHRVTPG